MFWEIIQKPSTVITIPLFEDKNNPSPYKRLQNIFKSQFNKNIFFVNEEDIFFENFCSVDDEKIKNNLNNEMISKFKKNQDIHSCEIVNNHILIKFDKIEKSIKFYRENIKILKSTFVPEIKFNVNFEKQNENIFYENVLKFKLKINMYNKIARIFTVNDFNLFKEKIENNDFEFVFDQILKLSVGIQTNVLIQEILPKLNDSEIKKIIENIGFDIGPIACTKYGAYSIQKLLSLNLSDYNKKLIIKYMDINILNMILDPIGNYSVQKIIPYDKKYLFLKFLDNLEYILDFELGLVILKNSMNLFSGYEKDFKKKFKELNRLYPKNVVDYFNGLNNI